MEDVKLEFPSLPQCKEDAEVSLSVTNTHRPLWLFAEGRTPGPNRRSLHLLEPCCLLRASRDPGAESRALGPSTATTASWVPLPFRRRWGRVWSTYFSPSSPRFGVEGLLEGVLEEGNSFIAKAMQGCVFNLILRDNLWCHRWTCGTHEPTCGIDVGPELGSVPSSSRSSWFDLIFGVFEASRDHQNKMSRN